MNHSLSRLAAPLNLELVKTKTFRKWAKWVTKGPQWEKFPEVTAPGAPAYRVLMEQLTPEWGARCPQGGSPHPEVSAGEPEGSHPTQGEHEWLQRWVLGLGSSVLSLQLQRRNEVFSLIEISSFEKRNSTLFKKTVVNGQLDWARSKWNPNCFSKFHLSLINKGLLKWIFYNDHYKFDQKYN